MKVVRKVDTEKFNNSSTCLATEYPTKDEDIDGAVIELTGRYPDKGVVFNEKCKEMAYVIDGSVKLIVEGSSVTLSKGDLVIINPGEKYFWEGNATMFVSSTPSWYPEQHKEAI